MADSFDLLGLPEATLHEPHGLTATDRAGNTESSN